MEKILIKTEYIKLDSLLKLSAVAVTGGEAKNIIKDGFVWVNGNICTERGKKIREGDKVDVGGEIIEVVLEK
jgi:Uncharacterized conserved protein